MCERGLEGEQGGPLGFPRCVWEEGRRRGRCDGLRLCPQVELRSYVSEPELATFSGDTAPPSLGLVGSESRYQTLPGRGKARFSMESSWASPPLPHHCSPALPGPHTLLPAAWVLSLGSSCQPTLGCREGLSVLPLAHILILILFYYIFPREQ